MSCLGSRFKLGHSTVGQRCRKSLRGECILNTLKFILLVSAEIGMGWAAAPEAEPHLWELNLSKAS